jgi:3-oxoadipate enol-lactonase
MKFKEKQLWIDDNHFSYIDEGKPGGETIIFIHGFPFNKLMWKNQIEVCKANYRVIAFDIRGHGNSISGTAGISLASLTRDLFLLMDALLIKKATVCGLSMGGYIALDAIRQSPERISALILCDTQCAADNDATKKKRLKTIEAIRKDGVASYARESLPKLLSRDTLATNSEVVDFVENSILNTPTETICNTLLALANRMENCSNLRFIAIPVLIMVGDSDQITPPKTAQYLHEHIPGSVLQIIDNAGHLSNLENPVSFNVRLLWFLGLATKVNPEIAWSNSPQFAKR